MGFFQNLVSTIVDSPEERARKHTEAAIFDEVLNRFLNETEIRYKLQHKGKSSFKEYEIYRYAFRRCRVITYLRSKEPSNVINISNEDIKKIELYVVEQYYKSCPETLYGPVKLKITVPMANQMERHEKQSLEMLLEKKLLVASIQGYIYVGTTPSDKKYVGKTIRSPERRYLEHREFGTGPFKLGDTSIEWKVVQIASQSELDNWESFYIGFYDSNKSGFNDNKGNRVESYKQGEKERRITN